MTGSQAMAAARGALRDMDDEDALRNNPLLLHLANDCMPFDRLRSHVLRALESLDPVSRADMESERQGRLYTILLRCDVQRVSHKTVTAHLGLSRRQFYRDRRAALLAFVEALGKLRPTIIAEPQAFDLRLLYIETLRQQGRYDTVWRESVRALRDMKGHAREVEVWAIAAEAARFFGNVRKSLEAIEAMRRAATDSPHKHLRRASFLRVAICEIALDWMQADFGRALRRIEAIIPTCGDERALYGRDATLFGILLNYGALIALDVGDWSGAAEFVRRAERIASRSEVPHTGAILHRLRARLALQSDGDPQRAAVELHDAVRMSAAHKALAPLAVSAVELGVVLDTHDRAQAREYIEYGLSIGRNTCGYDEFAVLFAAAAPHLADCIGTERTVDALDDVRSRSPLFRRADLYTRLAESSILAKSGRDLEAASVGASLAGELETLSLLPAAAEARVISAAALARERRVVAARRSLTRSSELIGTFGVSSTRHHAAELGTALALPVEVIKSLART